MSWTVTFEGHDPNMTAEDEQEISAAVADFVQTLQKSGRTFTGVTFNGSFHSENILANIGNTGDSVPDDEDTPEVPPTRTTVGSGSEVSSEIPGPATAPDQPSRQDNQPTEVGDVPPGDVPGDASPVAPSDAEAATSDLGTVKGEGQ